jgi:hypothetical protein
MISWIKNLFVPHKGNAYRPDLLERVSIGIMLILVLLSFAMANVQALLWMNSQWLVSTILPATIVTLTNGERMSDALGPLMRNEDLDRAARLKAENMAKESYFAHYSPNGVSPWHWFDEVGYNYLHAGENLAVHFTDSDAVVDAWMDSPTHRANIMNGEYEEIGVGSAKGIYNGHETIFVVQLFGTKRKGIPAPQVGGAAVESAPSVAVERVPLEESMTNVAPASVRTESLTALSPEVEIVSDVSSPDLLDSQEAVAQLEKQIPEEQMIEISREGEKESETVAVTKSGEEPARVAPLRVATAPSLWLQTVYGMLALLVIGSLLFSLFYEWRRHRLIQTVYAGGLLAVMALLLYVHSALTGYVLIV